MFWSKLKQMSLNSLSKPARAGGEEEDDEEEVEEKDVQKNKRWSCGKSNLVPVLQRMDLMTRMVFRCSFRLEEHIHT